MNRDEAKKKLLLAEHRHGMFTENSHRDDVVKLIGEIESPDEVLNEAIKELKKLFCDEAGRPDICNYNSGISVSIDVLRSLVTPQEEPLCTCTEKQGGQCRYVKKQVAIVCAKREEK